MHLCLLLYSEHSGNLLMSAQKKGVIAFDTVNRSHTGYFYTVIMFASRHVSVKVTVYTEVSGNIFLSHCSR